MCHLRLPAKLKQTKRTLGRRPILWRGAFYLLGHFPLSRPIRCITEASQFTIPDAACRRHWYVIIRFIKYSALRCPISAGATRSRSLARIALHANCLEASRRKSRVASVSDECGKLLHELNCVAYATPLSAAALSRAHSSKLRGGRPRISSTAEVGANIFPFLTAEK
jgi:hypothetical protein